MHSGRFLFNDWFFNDWLFNDWFGQATSRASKQLARGQDENLVVGVRYVPRRWGRWGWIIDKVTGNTWPTVWICLDSKEWTRFREVSERRPQAIHVEPGEHLLEVALSRDVSRRVEFDVPAGSVVSVLFTQDSLGGFPRSARVSTRRPRRRHRRSAR